MDICMNPAIKTQYFKSIQIIFAKKHSQRKKKKKCEARWMIFGRTIN
jgi:hypothetical protein